MANWKRWARRFAVGVSIFLAPLLLYLAAALASGLIADNAKWVEAERGIPVFVRTNGVHTWIVVPAVTREMDWRPYAPLAHIKAPWFKGNYIAFGFGNREFYLNTPTWSDLSIPTAIGAAFGGGPSLVHADHDRNPVADEWQRRIVLRPEEYRRLSRFIAASFRRDGQGHTVPLLGRGYSWSDVFYEANGRYDLRRTCNEWTGEALREAGVKVGNWTPFAQSIMWRFD